MCVRRRPVPRALTGSVSDQETTPSNGGSRLPSDVAPSAAALFALLWNALADLLGTAATAVLVRRAARRAAPVSPELAELVVERDGLEYRYSLPKAWGRPPTDGAHRAFQCLVGELLPVLTELTGSVAARHLARVQDLCAAGLISAVEDRT